MKFENTVSKAVAALVIATLVLPLTTSGAPDGAQVAALPAGAAGLAPACKPSAIDLTEVRLLGEVVSAIKSRPLTEYFPELAKKDVEKPDLLPSEVQRFEQDLTEYFSDLDQISELERCAKPEAMSSKHFKAFWDEYKTRLMNGEALKQVYAGGATDFAGYAERIGHSATLLGDADPGKLGTDLEYALKHPDSTWSRLINWNTFIIVGGFLGTSLSFFFAGRIWTHTLRSPEEKVVRFFKTAPRRFGALVNRAIGREPDPETLPANTEELEWLRSIIQDKVSEIQAIKDVAAAASGLTEEERKWLNLRFDATSVVPATWVGRMATLEGAAHAIDSKTIGLGVMLKLDGAGSSDLMQLMAVYRAIEHAEMAATITGYIGSPSPKSVSALEADRKRLERSILDSIEAKADEKTKKAARDGAEAVLANLRRSCGKLEQQSYAAWYLRQIFDEWKAHYPQLNKGLPAKTEFNVQVTGENLGLSSRGTAQKLTGSLTVNTSSLMEYLARKATDQAGEAPIPVPAGRARRRGRAEPRKGSDPVTVADCVTDGIPRSPAPQAP